jgi:hypothetical protein
MTGSKWLCPVDTGIDWSELETPRVGNMVCSAAMRIDEALVGAGISHGVRRPSFSQESIT